ncbi:MAG: hypothetical protein WD872_18540 [Pirellulaceae bacterium]
MRNLPLAIVLVLVTAAVAQAGPPSYLLLRQPESPGPNNKPGRPAARYYDVRTDGYAYGYFGAGPRTHWSRHFGVNRTYSQWSRW